MKKTKTPQPKTNSLFVIILLSFVVFISYFLITAQTNKVINQAIAIPTPEAIPTKVVVAKTATPSVAAVKKVVKAAAVK